MERKKKLEKTEQNKNTRESKIFSKKQVDIIPQIKILQSKKCGIKRKIVANE